MSGKSVVVPKQKSRSGIVGAVNREWDALVRAHRGAASRWAATHGVLVGCASLDDVLLRSTEEADAVLAALLAEVAHQDQVAARTVLQSMIGRMQRMARRDPRAGVDDYLSALWCVIATYPLQRRPTRIAANLSMEALKLVSGERRWLRCGEVSPWPPGGFMEADHEYGQIGRAFVDLAAVDVIGAGLEQGVIDAGASALLHSVYVDQLSSSEAALVHRSTPGAVRVRCSRAVRQLAEHAAELVDAA